jgi:hypothetical protein
MKNIVKISTLILISSFSLSAHSAGWEGLIQNLTQTRADLEGLAKETESLQKEKQAELDQWQQRKIDLDTQVQREKLRELQLAEKTKRIDSRVRTQNKVDPAAQKKLLTWISGLETWVQSSIPFEHTQRLQNLKNFKDRVHKGNESLEFILADLWHFMESETKLAQTNEFIIMDITLDGVTKKAEVARLGVQSLFAITPDGKTLQAKRQKNEWSWVPVSASDEDTSIHLLVKNLKSKNFTGYYTLPVEKSQAMGASL